MSTKLEELLGHEILIDTRDPEEIMGAVEMAIENLLAQIPICTSVKQAAEISDRIIDLHRQAVQYVLNRNN